MQKPDLDRLWRIWIKIGLPQQTVEAMFSNVASMIRSQVTEVVSILETKKMIDWYYFLIHGKDNDPSNFYFDVIFSVREGVASEDFVKALPDYCLDPKHLEHEFGESISGIKKELLKNGKIDEAWRIIGEQSEWIIHMVNVHKDGELTIPQFIQFMHFYMNTMGLGHLSRLQLPPPYALFQF
ncbi:hypothetical protein MUP77_20050 [Candidatus Bathyarchaeota archaeon]|nr:hypothetical protein [Candidatus Bathyarchaeota archaeon]